MFAIVDIQGNQYKISEGEKLQIASIDVKEGEKTTFDKVLLIAKENAAPIIGTPYIDTAFIDVKVLRHLKGDKIRVFKMKPKKRYSVTKGHRQKYTEIEISKINEKGGRKEKLNLMKKWKPKKK